jgi:hypothetical protein
MIDAPSAGDFKGKPRNPQWERELLDWLRRQSEEARFVFLMDLMKYQEIVALQLAHKSLTSRSSFIRLLEFCVAKRDASSIKYWLDSIVPRLGFRRSVDNLLRLSASEKSGVANALYWLPRYVNSDADRVKLRELAEAVSP